jgi:preprotein translocase subunit SecY
MYLGGAGYLNISSSDKFLVLKYAIVIACYCAGASIIMWMAEKINEYGIGNGISMILFANIVSRLPSDLGTLISFVSGKGQYYNADGELVSIPLWLGIVLAVLTVVFVGAMVVFVVWMTNAERRISVQYAKRVVGNKMYGGQNTHIPIKVNMSGVMPIIFASSILMLPTMILSFMGTPTSNWETGKISLYKFLSLFSVQGIFYAVVYFALIIGFAYFYATIQFNPQEMANNLRKNGGAIPGIRPGQPTTDFISKILSRITLLGALFLSVVAILPIIVGNIGHINISLGGTSVLIMVGVALDTVNNLESQMMMRHYKGFLD